MHQPAANPFSGLKATLAGILSGGWMGWVLGLLLARRLTDALTALEGLFAQWKAGTLPPLPLPLPASPARTPAPTATRQAAASRAPRAPRSAPRRRTAAGTPVTRRHPSTPLWAMPSATARDFRVPPSVCRGARCRKSRASQRRPGTS